MPTETGGVLTIIDTLRVEMFRNLEYFYKLTSPLLNHKSYDRQMLMIERIKSNVTALVDGLQESKEQLY